MKETVIVKKRFRDAIRRGTGEAHVIMLNNPDLDFSSDIIKACLTNFSYDGQSEDSRGFYLSELISLSKNQDRIRKAILAGLASEQGDTWSLTQLFDLAKIFAQNGDLEARTVIYDRFFNNPIEGSDWAGSAEILELDGMEGMGFIADKIGKALTVNPEDWQDSSMINYFQDSNPDIDVLNELKELALENRFVQIYLDNVNRTITGEKRDRAVVSEYKDIIEEILINKSYINLYKRELSEEETSLGNFSKIC